MIKISPGDHLYLVGCKPVTGLEALPEMLGAFGVNFKKSPSTRCALGEDAGFTVAITTKDIRGDAL